MPRKPNGPQKKKPTKKKTPTKNKRDLNRRMQKGVIDVDREMRDQRSDPNLERRFLSYNGMSEKFGGCKNHYIKIVQILQDDFDAPLVYIQERAGWGYTKDIASLPNIFVAAGDLMLLCAGWGSMERRRNGAFGNRVRPVMEKMMEAMGHDLSFDFSTLAERIVFRSSGYHDDLDVEIFESVVHTVLHQRELKFVYQKPMENGVLPPQENRHVQPRCMVCCDNAWYLFANDPSRNGELRKFALYRMKSAEDTGRVFLPAGPIDIDEVLKDAIGINTDGPVETVELLFRPSVAGLAREHYWHRTERFSTAPDGRLRLELDVALNPELEGRIQRYGSKVEVINPPELRKKFAEYARENWEQYRS